MKTLTEIMARHEALLTQKQPWISLYNQVGRYLHMRKDFYGTAVNNPSSFVPSEMFNTVAPTANSLAASALIGSLWPDGAKTIELVPAEDFEEKDDQEVRDHLAWETDRMRYYMDAPESGFSIASGEYALDQFSFGTTGFATFGTSETWPVTYRCWDVKEMVIDENADGVVDTIYRTRCMPIRQAVTEYPRASFSPETQARMGTETGLNETIEIVHCIYPRYSPGDVRPVGVGAQFMPIASLHYEKKQKHILLESGFDSMPVAVARLMKMAGWTYGWSSALAALPDILMLNAFHEAGIMAAEKSVKPPMGVWNDSVVNGRFRDSAGAVNVFEAAGRVDNRPPVFPISTVGDMRGFKEIIEMTRDAITTAFFVDRLMDFNNEARMTAYEVHQRQDLRYKSLGMIFGRQENEWMVPTAKRTHSILRAKGLLGLDPNSRGAQILEGEGRSYRQIPAAILRAIQEKRSYFRIRFRNSVTLMRNAEEISGIMTWTQTGGQMAAIEPGAVDPINVDRTMNRLRDLLGVHPSLQNAEEEIKAIRDNRAKIQQQQMQLEAQVAGAKTAQSAAQARAMDAKTAGGAALQNPAGALPPL